MSPSSSLNCYNSPYFFFFYPQFLYFHYYFFHPLYFIFIFFFFFIQSLFYPSSSSPTFSFNLHPHFLLSSSSFFSSPKPTTITTIISCYLSSCLLCNYRSSSLFLTVFFYHHPFFDPIQWQFCYLTPANILPTTTTPHHPFFSRLSGEFFSVHYCVKEYIPKTITFLDFLSMKKKWKKEAWQQYNSPNTDQPMDIYSGWIKPHLFCLKQNQRHTHTDKQQYTILHTYLGTDKKYIKKHIRNFTFTKASCHRGMIN